MPRTDRRRERQRKRRRPEKSAWQYLADRLIGEMPWLVMLTAGFAMSSDTRTALAAACTTKAAQVAISRRNRLFA